MCTHTCAHTYAHTQASWGCRQSRSLPAPHPAVLLSKDTGSSRGFGTRTHTRAAAPATASASTCGTNPQLLGRKAVTNLDSMLKSRDITLPAKLRLIKAMVFPVVMYGCESWTVKKAERRRVDAFRTVVLKTLESPLDCREIQPVCPKGDQSWVFIGRTDAKAEIPILWPPHEKS